MTLKRQIFLSFFMVAMLALLVSVSALCWINLRLSLDLYGNNLSNSTQIQANIMEEKLNQFLVRTGRFADTIPLRSYLSQQPDQRGAFLAYPGMSEEVVRFTDETLDSVSIFSVLDPDGTMLYATGTQKDITKLNTLLGDLDIPPEQTIVEIQWEEGTYSLAIITPIEVRRGDTRLGSFICVYNTDYFFKSISLHQQFGVSNAFIYCTVHQQLVKAKHPIQSLEGFSSGKEWGNEAHEQAILNGETSLVRWQQVANTPWVLVNALPLRQVYAQTISYMLLGGVVLLISLLVVVVLSHRQSDRILQPLRQLLAGVEYFLLSEKGEMPVINLNKKTEIGYLADKFSNVVADMATAQQNLQESNYLYDAILHSAYCFRIYVDLQANKVSSSDEALSVYLQNKPEVMVAQKVLAFFHETASPIFANKFDTLAEIIEGTVSLPQEIEICSRLYLDERELWLRMMSVPITDETGHVQKVVLHFADITEKKLEDLRLVESSQRDQHSGLLNKTAFAQLAQQVLENQSHSSALFFIDLDNFKRINDELGHAAGDVVLFEMSQKITAHFRSDDLVCRYGGDEFAVLVPGLGAQGAEQKADLLIHTLPIFRQSPFGDEICVSASIGVCISAGNLSLKQMLLEADKAMYQAKEHGKNQYSIWKEGACE